MSKWKRLFAGVMIIAVALAFAGCKRAPEKADANFRVVASFYPIYISALNVAGNIKGVEVSNMAPPSTGCLHDYQLSTKDLKVIENADVFVINGGGMETFLDKVTQQLPNLKIINASEGIHLLKDKDGQDNAHVWVSVTNDIKQVQNIVAQLSAADPKDAAAFRKNGDAYITKLTALKNEMHEGLENIKTKNIITFHEAFPYFAEEFGLNIVDVIEREPGTAPTPAELNDTIKIVKQSGVKALFAEPQYPDDAAQAIAKETGAKVYTLDPVVSGDSKPDSYINLMEKNLKSLEEALN